MRPATPQAGAPAPAVVTLPMAGEGDGLEGSTVGNPQRAHQQAAPPAQAVLCVADSPLAWFKLRSLSRRWALRHGVPAADIRVEQRSRITEENLREAWYIVQAEGIGRVLIVTDPLHMRRSMRLAHDLGLDAGAAPTRSSRYKTAGAKLPFFAREVWLLTGWEVLRVGGL